MIVLSKIIIEIDNLKFTSQNSEHINTNYKIIIKLKEFGLIPIFQKVYDKNKIEKINKKLDIGKRIKKLDLNKVIESVKEDKKLNKNVLKIFIKEMFEIIKINLRVEIGTEDAALTAIIIGILSTIISIMIRKKIKNVNVQRYKIIPKYCNLNLINIDISGIFGIKVIHIINVICILVKGKGESKNERTSDRKSYGYSYE